MAHGRPPFRREPFTVRHNPSSAEALNSQTKDDLVSPCIQQKPAEFSMLGSVATRCFDRNDKNWPTGWRPIVRSETPGGRASASKQTMPQPFPSSLITAQPVLLQKFNPSTFGCPSFTCHDWPELLPGLPQSCPMVAT